jgi:hypothetical protein
MSWAQGLENNRPTSIGQEFAEERGKNYMEQYFLDYSITDEVSCKTK